MNLALNNLQKLISHKIQPTNQPVNYIKTKIDNAKQKVLVLWRRDETVIMN